MSERPKIKLVLSGSGVLYFLHAGAIQRIAEDYEIEAVTGVSGGAIVAGALASGFEPGRELNNLLLNTIPSKNDLLDWNWFPFFKWGLLKGDRIEQTFKRWFAPTFADTKIPLNVGTVNLNQQKQVIFGTETTPEFSVSKAIRASMTFPVAFEPVEIDGDLYADGGIAANFPLDIYGNGMDVIGVKIVPSGSDYREIEGLWEYLVSMISTMIEAVTREHVEDATFARFIRIKDDTSPMKLDMERREAKKLITKGYESADRWLNS